MKSKIASFQIVQGNDKYWSPDVIALCADGSLWIISLGEFEKGCPNWKRMTPEIDTPTPINTFMSRKD